MDAVQKCVWIAAILLASARPAVHGAEQTIANSSTALGVANYSMPAAAGHDRPVDTGIVEGEADERRRQTSWHLNRQFDHFFAVTTTTTSRPVKKLPMDVETTSAALDIASSDGAAGTVINGLRNNKLPVIRPFFLDPAFLGSKTSNNPDPLSSKTDDVLVMAEGNSRGRQGVQRSFANFPTLLNQPDKHDDGYADSIDRRTIWPPPASSGMLSGMMIVTPSSTNLSKTAVSSSATSKEKTTTIFAETAKVPKEEEKGPPMVLTTKFNDTTIGTAFDLSEDHTDADQLMLSMKVFDDRHPSTSTLRNLVKVTPSSIINVISGQQHGVSSLWNYANVHHKLGTATTVSVQDQPTTLDPGPVEFTVDKNATVMSRAEPLASTPTPVMTSHTAPHTTLGPPADVSVDKNNFNYTTRSSVMASQPLTSPGGFTTSSSVSTSQPPSMTTSAKMDITVKAVFMNSTSEELHLMMSSTAAAAETEATKVSMTLSTARTPAASAEVFMAPSSTANAYVEPPNVTEESRGNETTSQTSTSTVSSALKDVTSVTTMASKFTSMSTSSVLPEVSSTSTTISALTSMSSALPELTSRSMLTSSSSALPELTFKTTVTLLTSSALPEVPFTTTAGSTEPKRRVNFLSNPRKAFRSRPSTVSTPSTASAWTEFPLTSSTRSSVNYAAGLITRSTVEPKYVPTMPPPIPTSTRRQHVITVPAIDDAGFVIVAEDEDYDEESSALRPTSQQDDAQEDGLIPEGANEAIMVSSAIGGCAVVFFAVIMIFCMLRNRRTVYRAPTESTSASASSSASSASPFHTMKLPMKV